MTKKPAKPEPHIPTSQPGPAAGADPAVVIDRPADPRLDETDPSTLMQLAQDNGAGPRQEPIHHQTAPQAAVENTVDKDGAPVKHEAPKPKKHAKIDDEEMEALADQMIAAMEAQDVKVSADSYGRTYEFYTTNVSNQSVVMCVVKRGGDACQMPVMTQSLHTADARKNATDAIRALDGMLV